MWLWLSVTRHGSSMSCHAQPLTPQSPPSRILFLKFQDLSFAVQEIFLIATPENTLEGPWHLYTSDNPQDPETVQIAHPWASPPLSPECPRSTVMDVTDAMNYAYMLYGSHEGAPVSSGTEELDSFFKQPDPPSLVPLFKWDLTPSFERTSDEHSTSSVHQANHELARCEVCGKAFAGDYRNGNLARHMKHHHSENVQTYNCEYDPCDRAFQRADARRHHYKQRHTDSESSVSSSNSCSIRTRKEPWSWRQPFRPRGPASQFNHPKIWAPITNS